uniref:C2H2-type domain-containing protein n=1 Tax=Anopheles dirus TaxID=7168 RepID=A0A182NKL8_9DIPT
MDVAPSMVQRSGDKLIVRRVVSGEQVHLSGDLQHPAAAAAPPERGGDATDQQLLDGWRRFSTEAATLASYDSEQQLSDGEPGPSGKAAADAESDQQQQQQLPQCKIKRNYSCGRCTYFTQNPRKYLTHLRDTHGEKIVINECKRCLYASRHYQKLVRHMKMVHGSVDGIRKSAFGATRRRAPNRGYGLQLAHQAHQAGPSPGTSRLSRSEATQLTTAYVQQLVASGLPKLLEEIEKSAASSSALVAATFARDHSQMMQADMEQLKRSMPYSSDETVQEASEADRLDSGPTPDEDVILVSKKRSRPIPNLIPLNMSTSGLGAPAAKATAATVQRFVKPIPLAALRAENGDAGAELPLSLTKHRQTPPMTSAREDIMTKCVYCELAFKTVEALANHIKLAHKDDLIASLLANTFEDPPAADAKGPTAQRPKPDPDRTANEIWKRLLECSVEAAAASARKQHADYEAGSSKEPGAGSVSNDETDDDNREEHQSQTFCGVETAPGYGEVTNRLPTVEPGVGSAALMKKVFKCPHCSFWASTASRFHVHIVGHLNKKPFECSLCAYRSNWRWDITKHIRLKTIRDPSHKNAGVLMNDETGRRNYTKYNKYIALMQITDK